MAKLKPLSVSDDERKKLMSTGCSLKSISRPKNPNTIIASVDQTDVKYNYRVEMLDHFLK